MRILSVVILATIMGCSKKTAYGDFTEATGQFTAQLPSNWHRDGHDDLSRSPMAVMTWIAEISAEKEGQQIGAMIHINRFRRKDVPPAFKKATLDPTDAMFGKGPLPPGAPDRIADLTVEGFPARLYRRDFETVLGGGMHSVKGPFKMTLEDVVVQTPDSYYVLEYRATAELFEKYHPAFRRLVETIKLTPGSK
ncbi:MAG: hypothetical protein M0D55_14190 [Elusimicrobiota bacterium]|nr:MAG: hypothetical protein M0D55_14190 [Elusimicrobiota bacterium]